MTLEELFVEKYQDLEEENSMITRENYEYEREIKAIKEQLYKLKNFIKIRTSNYDNSRYMVLDNYIYEKDNKELFDFIYDYIVEVDVIDLSEGEEEC